MFVSVSACSVRIVVLGDDAVLVGAEVTVASLRGVATRISFRGAVTAMKRLMKKPVRLRAHDDLRATSTL